MEARETPSLTLVTISTAHYPVYLSPGFQTIVISLTEDQQRRTCYWHRQRKHPAVAADRLGSLRSLNGSIRAAVKGLTRKYDSVQRSK